MTDRPTIWNYLANGIDAVSLPHALARMGGDQLRHMLPDVQNALMAPARAYRGELGNYEDDPQRYIREGMNFAGTAAVGGSVVPHPQGALVSNSVRAAERDPVSAINSLTQAVRGAEPKPAMEMRVYRGSQSPEIAPNYREPYWATPDRQLADHYAGTHDPKQFDVPYADLAPHEREWFNEMAGSRGNVTPGVARFENPLVVDAEGRGWSRIPFEGKRISTDALATMARDRGHDGLVVHSVNEIGDYPSTSVAALKPGTVRSPLTGEVLFANSDNSALPGTVIREASREQPTNAMASGIRAYHGSHSQALEAARGLKQAKGTPEQMLAQLKSAGVKDAEIEATGLDKLLATPNGLTAYHGSPYSFDKFDSSNFNRGEGEALGALKTEPWLTWATRDKARGEFYQTAFGRRNRDFANEAIKGHGLNADEARALRDAVEYMREHPFDDGVSSILRQYMPDGEPLKRVANAINATAKRLGKLYETRVDVDESNLLRYGGIENQTPFVADALRKALTEKQLSDWTTWKEILFNQRDQAVVAKAHGIQGYQNGSDIGVVDPERMKIVKPFITRDEIVQYLESNRVGVREAARDPNAVGGIRAYHGSPHDFDRFSLDKIGTGEGAQAYGPGLYFAENEGVAKSYRDALAGQRLRDGSVFDDANPAHQAAAYISGTQSREEALSAIADDIAMSRRQNDEAHAQRLLRAKGMVERGEPIPELNNGRMYEVRINADPEHFLDWDKPLSQQSEAVRNNAMSVVPDDRRAYFEKWASDPEVSARDVYEAIGGVLAPGDGRNHASPRVAHALREAGIPGIKYLDQGSRGAGEGSRNYVVFDDKLIDILRKYGLLGTLGLGAAGQMFGAEPPQNALMQGKGG